MPERYDSVEAQRLVADVSALLAELEVGDDPESATRRALAAQEVSFDAEAEERLSRMIEGRETFYRAVAGLWGTMKQGLDQRNMSLIRGAHAGLRAITLAELEGGEADK